MTETRGMQGLPWKDLAGGDSGTIAVLAEYAGIEVPEEQRAAVGAMLIYFSSEVPALDAYLEEGQGGEGQPGLPSW